jgi:hypothetical protein
MIDAKRTTQFTVTCKDSSRPVVEKSSINNAENPNYIDLYLVNGSGRSNNPKDYTAHYEGVQLRIIKLDGNTLTVEIS